MQVFFKGKDQKGIVRQDKAYWKNSTYNMTRETKSTQLFFQLLQGFAFCFGQNKINDHKPGKTN